MKCLWRRNNGFCHCRNKKNLADDECTNETDNRYLDMQEDENIKQTYTSSEKAISRKGHTKKKWRNCGRAANGNLIRESERPREGAKTDKSPVNIFDMLQKVICIQR